MHRHHDPRTVVVLLRLDRQLMILLCGIERLFSVLRGLPLKHVACTLCANGLSQSLCSGAWNCCSRSEVGIVSIRTRSCQFFAHWPVNERAVCWSVRIYRGSRSPRRWCLTGDSCIVDFQAIVDGGDPWWYHKVRT